MAGSDDEDEVADRFVGWDGSAVQLTLRDDSRQIVAWCLATRGDERFEVFEVLLHEDNRVAFGLPLKRRIRGPEELLREAQQERFVRFRHAEDRHDDSKRVPDRDVIGEVALFAFGCHPIDVGACELREPRLDEPPQVPRREPSLSHCAIGLVVRLVHVDHRPHQRHAPVPDRPYALFDLDRQELIAWTAEEHLGMPRDLEHIGMLRDEPEGTVPVWTRPTPGVVCP